MKLLKDYSLKDFLALGPPGPWGKEIKCDCIVILPSKRVHDSGYRIIGVVPVKESKPLGLIGNPDVIHLGGIGGLGKDWFERKGSVPKLVPPIPWSIDCLPKSKAFRVFAPNYWIIVGNQLSSLEIWAEGR